MTRRGKKEGFWHPQGGWGGVLFILFLSLILNQTVGFLLSYYTGIEAKLYTEIKKISPCRYNLSIKNTSDDIIDNVQIGWNNLKREDQIFNDRDEPSMHNEDYLQAHTLKGGKKYSTTVLIADCSIGAASPVAYVGTQGLRIKGYHSLMTRKWW